MQIAALVSGGVDSSVIVPLLKEQGFEPVIFYIQIGMDNEPGFMDCPSEEDIEITTFIAKKYGCRFEIANLHDEYWDRVVNYTIDSVRRGFTPNPDVMCNRFIKFGSFEDKFGKDFDKIATGHYARVLEENGHFYLGTSKDRRKDQTYFLGRITYPQLSKAMFPVGGFEKGEVRKLAEQLKLPSAGRPDSQGICFLGKVNYNEFIRRYTGEKEGDIVELETGKILGKHKGFWFHTIGQRKGLGLSQGPWFVVKKDIPANIVYVSNGYDPVAQHQHEVFLDDFLFINEIPDRDYSIPQPVMFKIRHQPEFNEGMMVKHRGMEAWRHGNGEAGKFVIESVNSIAGVAPGQFGVIYDTNKNICLGSGVITDNVEG
ncbi:MAG: tRNA 2-thiouridine(34) synthase MnmA [Syntrophaceae bacterium]|nr:tRNA 2-thiouridine(34) synthase MnmA [Syntrophaceae bacterium]